MLDDRWKTIADDYVEPGIVQGFDKVWPDCEHRVRAELEHESAVAQTKLPRQIEQAEKEVRWHEKFDDYLREELMKAKRVMIDRWSKFYCWATFIFWWSVAIGEMFAFPVIYRDIFDLPLSIGWALSPLFPAASLFVKFIKYEDLSEKEKCRFRTVIFWIWVITLGMFIIPFIISRALVLRWQHSASILSLSGSSSGNSLFSFSLTTMIFGWLWGMTTVVGMAIIHSRFRDPATRVNNLEGEIQVNREPTKQVTEVYTTLLAELRTVNTRIKCMVLAVEGYLKNTIYKQLLERRRIAVKEMHPYLFSDEAAPQNGKSQGTTAGATLALVAALLLSAMSCAYSQDIFFVQDVGRTSAEQEFQGFGQVVLAMSAGATITLFGSDGSQCFQGTIENTYETKQLRQRQAIIDQARPVYQKIQARPSDVRDYATVLADILPRVSSSTLLIIQGKPLYRLDPINWDERIPSVSWAFHPASPLGEKALSSATVRFRAVILFSPTDFVSPNHRAELNRFWKILLGRLNGMLVLFTTDTKAVTALIPKPTPMQKELQPDFPTIPETERYAPLKLIGVTRLGVAGP